MEIKNKINKLYRTGFFHIFFINIIKKILMFCNGIFIVQVLSKESFGIYSYSQNLLSFFLLFSGLGLDSGLIQFGSRNNSRKEREKIFSYILKRSVSINIGMTLIILLFCKFADFKIEEGRIILFYMSGFPIFNIIVELFLDLYRTELKNKEMSILSFVYTLLTVVFMILGGYYYRILGVIIGKYISYFFTLIFIIKYRKITEIKKYLGKTFITSKLQKEIFKYSITAMINNSIICFIHMIDIFFIGYLIGNKEIIASYKTASMIPFGLEFIPASIMIYIYPYFVKNSDKVAWIKNNYIKVLKFLIVINLIIVMINLYMGEFFIAKIFGEEYIDSIKIFNILCIGYFFTGSFRVLGSNIIFALGKPKFNVYSSMVASISNMLLNLFLIKKYGSIGAAYATLIVFIIWSVLVNYFVYRILNSGKYLVNDKL